jgi:hypothetical protein
MLAAAALKGPGRRPTLASDARTRSAKTSKSYANPPRFERRSAAYRCVADIWQYASGRMVRFETANAPAPKELRRACSENQGDRPADVRSGYAFRTQVRHRAMSVSCQTATSRIRGTQRKSCPKAALKFKHFRARSWCHERSRSKRRRATVREMTEGFGFGNQVLTCRVIGLRRRSSAIPPSGRARTDYIFHFRG